jgi:glucosamine-6-phosphate deaminase
LHGIGVDGHLGFNEPGTGLQSPSREVTLAPSTRSNNAKFFAAGEEVPLRGRTLGLRCLSSARNTYLLASGASKQGAMRQSLLGPLTDATPGSVLQTMSNVRVIVDRAAVDWVARLGSLGREGAVERLLR